MEFEKYISSLPTKTKLSDVKIKILRCLWGNDNSIFPKPWISSEELLSITNQKYFDRRARELRDQLGCDIETAYQEEFSGHAWRIKSLYLSISQDREYLNKNNKIKLFESYGYCCSVCGQHMQPGVRGLQADHKIPLSRSGTNHIDNWQPLCNNCNVGKRRACEGCSLDCLTCSWAFPDKLGVKTMILVTDKLLSRISSYAVSENITVDKVFEDAAEYYLDNKENRS